MKPGLFLFFAFILAQAADRADFLVLDDPSRLSFYNQFQESFSADDRRALPPLMPVQIVDDSAFLGDGVTPAIKGRYRGSVLFLQKENDGRLRGLPPGGKNPVYRNCRVVGDTVEVIRPGVRLCSANPCGSGALVVAPGERLCRLFEKERAALVFRLSETGRYYWAALPEGSWKKAEAAAVIIDTVLPAEALSQIREKLDAANRAYLLWFGHFNKVTGQDQSAPRWGLETGPGSLRCVLQGPPHYREALQESTARLAQDIDGLLIGRPFRAHPERGDIVVERRISRGSRR